MLRHRRHGRIRRRCSGRAVCGAKEAAAIYPAWRGGYYYAGKPRLTSRRRSACSTFRDGRATRRHRSSRGVREVAGAALSGAAGTRHGWQGCRRCSASRFLAHLRGRHAWLTEEGTVVIEVRGDAVLISESLDEETTTAWKQTSGRNRRPRRQAMSSFLYNHRFHSHRDNFG